MRNLSCRCGGLLFAVIAILLLSVLTAAPAWAGGSGTTGGCNGDCCGPGSSPPPPAGNPTCGNPITIGTGGKFEAATDYATAGPNRLTFERYYNSPLPNTYNLFTSLGPDWRSNYDSFLHADQFQGFCTEKGCGIDVVMPDNKNFTFYADGSGHFAGATDVPANLTQSGTSFTLTDWNDTIWTWSQPLSSREILLTSIRARNGYTRPLSYNAQNHVSSVTDSYGRTLSFTYNSLGQIASVKTPDGLGVNYSYDAGGKLVGVLFGPLGETLSYIYDNSGGGNFRPLLGIIDEDSNLFATWTYNSIGEAVSSQHAGGADLTTVDYDDTNPALPVRTVTNALGQEEVYKFAATHIYNTQFDIATIPLVTEIDRLATPTTAAAKRLFSYDANGYYASKTDWNGNLTTYVNDARGLAVKTTEAKGTPQQRVTTTAWNPKFRLPDKIVAPELTTIFTYDADGNLLSRTETDTTTHKTPYATNGESRTWKLTWANFLPTTLTDPRGNTTKLAWDASGALVSVTNPLGQVTKITSHLPGGLPTTIVDPNGVTTTLTWDVRDRLVKSAVTTAAGVLTTNYEIDPVGNLIHLVLPDGSALSNVYDAAHRLVTSYDNYYDTIVHALDGLGNPTATTLQAGLNAFATITGVHSADYDALGRLLRDIGGAGQTTSYSYDANGNRVAITDPRGHLTHQAFDPLNRLVERTDAAGGVTATAWDPQDHPVQITDANGHATQYVYDGFGDVIETASPDSGVTVNRYDAAGNLIQRVDAAGAVTNLSWDGLNRPTARNYPGDAADDVAYFYDEAGAAFGIGRLTHLTDAGGTLKFAYDERGNVLSETRTSGTTTLVTKYAYNPASRLTTITYPSGAVVGYSLDAAGRVFGVSVTPPGGSTPLTVVHAGIKYLPFGPPQSFAYGNGIGETRGFDLAYRMTSLADKGNAFGRTLGYGYDPDDNVVSLSDTIAGGSQSFAYDALNRLTKAKGFYGTQSWAYDPVGNLLSAGSSAAATQFRYAAGSNRLAALAQGGVTTRKFGDTATGNIDLDEKEPSHPSSAKNLVLGYSRANRLASVSGPLKTSPVTRYVYDAFGERLAKTRSGTPAAGAQFRYDLAGHLIEEADFSGAAQTLTDTIYLGDRPVARLSAGTLLFLHDDRLGTLQTVTGANQGVDWQALYQPYGAIKPLVAAIPQNLRFPGQFADAESGDYHNGFRDYDPSLGRYLESDPIGLKGGLNTYVYAADNPVKLTDPSGLQNDKGGNLGDLGKVLAGACVAKGVSSLKQKISWRYFGRGLRVHQWCFDRIRYQFSYKFGAGFGSAAISV